MSPQWRFYGLMDNRIAHLYEFEVRRSSVIKIHDEVSYELGHMVVTTRCDGRMPVYLESKPVVDWTIINVVCDACLTMRRN